MAVAIQNQDEVDKRTRYRAVFQGVTGWVWWDKVERLVFGPDEAGMVSQAYRDSLVEVGNQWSEWVFEVDVVMCQVGGVRVIEL